MLFCLLRFVARLFGLSPATSRPEDPAARERWQERRRRFREKLQEACAVLREDDAPATGPEAASPPSSDPLEG